MKPNLYVPILVCLGAGFIGSTVTTPAIASWYVFLEKPWFSPPNWLFAPVWTILYICMGLASYRIWKHVKKDKRARSALIIFGIQLLLNVAWSFAFFYLKNPWFAYAVIIALWVAIYSTIIRFRRIDQVASLLLIPYILWVTFASHLNLAIAILN